MIGCGLQGPVSPAPYTASSARRNGAAMADAAGDDNNASGLAGVEFTVTCSGFAEPVYTSPQ